MKRTIITVSLLSVAWLLTGCGKDYVQPDGTKIFGQRTLKDGTTKAKHMDNSDGSKAFDVTWPPDGTENAALVVFPDGEKDFGRTWLKDGTTKIARIEFPNGNKHFDVTMFTDGSQKTARVELPNGEKDFDRILRPDGSIWIAHAVLSNGSEIFNCAKSPDKAWTCSGPPSGYDPGRATYPSQSSSSLSSLTDMQAPTCFSQACMDAVKQHNVEQESKRLYGQNK